MTAEDVLSELLGPALRLPWDGWSQLERDLCCELPGDVKNFLESYGGVRVFDFLAILHPGALQDYKSMIAGSISRNPAITEPLLPNSGGMLIWGNTIEADQLFLIQRPEGWRVAAWCRQWARWYESELGIAEWTAFALSPSQNLNWLPEWEYPLEVTRD